jgi:lipopolysaccharide/colanic/teichoic acid biosynthesis glycosyltransferase
MAFATLSNWPRVAIRIADVTITVALVAFTAPLLAGLALLVKLNDGGPVLFRHERVGLGGKRFKCLKFRTMAVDADKRLRDLLTNDPKARAEWLRDQKLRRDPRVTRIGAILRKSSLDELPQLWNVLTGDMSLVGPRPIVQDEVARYGRYFDA